MEEETFDGKILKKLALVYPSESSSLTIKISHGHQGNPELPKTNIELTVYKIPESQSGYLFVSDELNFPLSGSGIRVAFPDTETTASIFPDDDKNYHHALQLDQAAPVPRVGEISYGVMTYHLKRRTNIATSVFISSSIG